MGKVWFRLENELEVLMILSIFKKKILLLGVDKNASIYALSDQINSYKKAVWKIVAAASLCCYVFFFSLALSYSPYFFVENIFLFEKKDLY